MNQLATQQERIPMDSVGVTNTGTGTKIAPQNLGEVVKFAEVMSRADIALPKHLRGNPGACMAVALQALEWQMSPFAVASKSYSVGGAIAYEAQLIAAVVNTRSGIKGRLRYQFDGDGAALTCTVTGILDGEECVYTSPTIGSITTKNSPLWKSDPQQQLGYFAARSWARRHCPEVILGVYDRDETEEFRGPEKAKNITPAFDPLSDEPIATQQVSSAGEQTGATVAADDPHDALTGEIMPNTNTDDADPSHGSSVADETIPASQSAGPETVPPAVSGSTIPEEYRQHFIDFARKALKTAADTDLPEAKRNELIEDSVMQYREVIPNDLWGKLSGIKLPIMYVVTGQRSKEKAASFIAQDVLDCDVSEIGG